MTLERVTVRLPEEDLEEVEGLVERGEFPNRSEAIRQAVQDLLGEEAPPAYEAPNQPTGPDARRGFTRVEDLPTDP